MKYETFGQKAGFLHQIIEYGLTSDFIKRQSDILKSMDKAMINKLAQQHLHPEKMVIVVVGSKYKLKDPLKKLGYKVIETRLTD